MNVVFIIKALNNPGGGAERVLAEVANGLVRRGHAVTIISSDGSGKPSYYTLDPAIQAIRLEIGNTSAGSKPLDFLRRIASYRRSIIAAKPDVAVAFMNSSYVPAGLALLGTGIPLVASEHIGPEHYRNRYLQWLLMQAMPLLSAKITVVSEQIRLSYNAWLRRKMTAIANPVSFSPQSRPASRELPPDGPCRILSVGRLVPQKNQSCLIDAFARISAEFPQWSLRIAGEGELRNPLESQIARLGLYDRVELPGNIADIGAEYRDADLFVLPSVYESFGLATAEAIMHGLPVVGFADCPGTNELIRDGENGVLVPGAEKTIALAAALRALIGNPDALHSLKNAPNQWLQDKYSLSTVLNDWEKMLNGVLRK